MKSMLYIDGPPRVTMGDAGQFERGKARPVEDDLAAALLRKTRITFYEAGTEPGAKKPGKEA